MSLNLCALVGCLARDPHTSWEGEGKQVTGLTLKVQEPHSTFVIIARQITVLQSAEVPV